MLPRHVIRLQAPAHEMAQEEIRKQAVFLSPRIANVRFVEGGGAVEFEAPEELGAEVSRRLQGLCQRVQRGLRNLQRKVVFRSAASHRPTFRGPGMAAGVHILGQGQAGLEGIPLRLFRYVDRVFAALGEPWQAEPFLPPALIPADVLARCDYFRSFPHNVTFACHLHEDVAQIEGFRARHQERTDLDEGTLRDMDAPTACLSPALCYHVYHLNHDRTLSAAGLAYGVGGKCFRFESSNMTDLRRLWDFTMREIVFLGGRDDVLARRERAQTMVARFLDDHGLAAEIRTASDPFFIAPDAVAKTYFQLSAETKLELSLMLPDDERLAIGSLNYHSDFFGRAFNVHVEGHGPMHSVCVAIGLERFVYGFLAQHGSDPREWPECVRHSPEFA